MIKTYISALLVVLLAGAQMVRAQNSMDDVFAQLDAANDAGGEPVAAVVQPAAPVAQPEPAAPAEVVSAAPAAAESASDAVPVADDKVGALYLKGNAYYRAGDYDNARRAYEAVVIEDPYHSRAITMLKRTAQRIDSKEGKMQTATRAQAFADVEAAWSQKPLELAGSDASSVAPSAGTSADQLAIQRMEARLKAIQLAGLDFRDASIEDVVLFLSESSRRLDSTGKGANILLLGMDSEEGNNVTTSITDISLYDALQVVAGSASLKVEMRPNAVAIMPANYVADSEMAMKSYDVLPEVGSDLEAASGDDAGGSDDLFGDSPSSDSDGGPVDVAAFFTIVDFPEGSSATYQPRFHKLFVKNTPENLKQIEAVLADLNEEAVLRSAQQVEIEAKFVEFNEGSLRELGFDWNVYGSGSIASMELDGRDVLAEQGIGNDPSIPHAAVDPLTGQVILSDNNANDGRPGQNVFGSTHRNNSTAFDVLQSGLASSMGGTPASMMFGNGDIDLKITAMEQEGTADVLSAPKVTTKSGSEAIIRGAETHRYPQDYDVETGQRTSPVVKPQDWEDFDLGVTLKVTPVVNPESNTIDLTLHPEEVKFLGYDPYRVGANGYGDSFDDETAVAKDPSLIAKMPFFRRRSVETQVTIADGQTVVMGGLVDERTETFRDQVPFLGDIPYLGRLFRTEGSRSVKKNLVIYVTAKQVDASGLTTAQRKLARQ